MTPFDLWDAVGQVVLGIVWLGEIGVLVTLIMAALIGPLALLGIALGKWVPLR